MLTENGVKKQEHLKLKTRYKLGTCKPTSPSTSSPCSSWGRVGGVNRNAQLKRVMIRNREEIENKTSTKVIYLPHRALKDADHDESNLFSFLRPTSMQS